MGKITELIALILAFIFLLYAAIAIFMSMVEKNPIFGLQGFIAGILGAILIFFGSRKKRASKSANLKHNDHSLTIHTPEIAVKILRDWMIENMYDALKASTPSSSPIDISNSEILDSIVNSYSEKEAQKIIKSAFFNALIEIKGEKVAKSYTGFQDMIRLDDADNKD